MKMSNEAKFRSELKNYFEKIDPLFGNYKLKECGLFKDVLDEDEGRSDAFFNVEVSQGEGAVPVYPNRFGLPKNIKESYEVSAIEIVKVEQPFFGNQSVVLKVKLKEKQ